MTGCWRELVLVQDWEAEPSVAALLQQMLTELHWVVESTQVVPLSPLDGEQQ